MAVLQFRTLFWIETNQLSEDCKKKVPSISAYLHDRLKTIQKSRSMLRKKFGQETNPKVSTFAAESKDFLRGERRGKELIK